MNGLQGFSQEGRHESGIGIQVGFEYAQYTLPTVVHYLRHDRVFRWTDLLM